MSNFRDFMNRNRKPTSIVAAIVLVLFIGAIDSMAGIEVSLSAFYLIPIFLCAYYAGLWAGVFISFASVFVYLLGDQILSIQYTKSASPYWNAGIRFLLFAAVTYAVSKRRTAARAQ